MMSDTGVELGPKLDYLVVAFPAGQANFSGEMASQLTALMGSNTVRVLDLLLVRKDVDGSVEASELRDADDSEVGQLRRGRGRSGGASWPSPMSRRSARDARAGQHAAAVLVWEQTTWAAPFATAVRRSGGQLVTSGRIPTQAILAAIDADRAAEAQGG